MRTVGLLLRMQAEYVSGVGGALHIDGAGVDRLAQLNAGTIRSGRINKVCLRAFVISLGE